MHGIQFDMRPALAMLATLLPVLDGRFMAGQTRTAGLMVGNPQRRHTRRRCRTHVSRSYSR